jgi:serine/threonine protein kinase
MLAAKLSTLNDLRAGLLFQQYRLLENIGAGGQGVVWSALDQNQRRIVAIKFSEAPQTDQQQVDNDMFSRQAGDLLRLQHPYILPIYEMNNEGHTHYLVSPFIPGGSLRSRLSGAVFPLTELLLYAAKIAAALDYLHTRGVIHRDLKPSNILMDLSSNIYVADFGLARVILDSTQALHTGRGTPIYSPPEQHTMRRITPQSDIYSFGLVLYEMFTRELPWRGEKTLGIQQLHSQEELPDPREVNPELPADLAPVLRRITAADSSSRPDSATEALQLVCQAFGLQPPELPPAQSWDDANHWRNDIAIMIGKNLDPNTTSRGEAALNLTKFAMIDLHVKQASQGTVPLMVKRFILESALLFGYNDDTWWEEMIDPHERLLAATAVINRGNDKARARAIRRITYDQEIGLMAGALPDNVTSSLLETTGNASAISLRHEALETLRHLTPAASRWQEVGLNTEQDQALASITSSPLLGDDAARLIGHIRSETAVQWIISNASADQRLPALLQVQEQAGSLPSSVPAALRWQVYAEWIMQRLFAMPTRVLSAYGLALLGGLLGFGMQVFLTYRLPTFMSTTRVTIALEQGFFTGLIFGAGILLTRLIMERFPKQSAFSRLLSGTLLGAGLFFATFYTYDVIFLHTPPSGPLILSGSLLIALGYALAGLLRRRWLKMLVCLAAILAAVAGSWWLHLSSTALSPIFYYEYTWTTIQVLGTMLAAALPMAILGNLLDLSPKEI